MPRTPKSTIDHDGLHKQLFTHRLNRRCTMRCPEQSRRLDAYLEETEPGALQRELAAMNQAEYQEAGMLIEHFTNLGIEKGLKQGLEQGIEQGARAKALEDARKLREHGVSWEIITSATGVKPEDLQGTARG